MHYELKEFGLAGDKENFFYNVVQNPVHIHDFNATVLHSISIDHEKLTFKFQGRHFRLTDVHGPDSAFRVVTRDGRSHDFVFQRRDDEFVQALRSRSLTISDERRAG